MEELFELQIVHYPEIRDTMRDLNILKKVWDLEAVVESNYNEWKQIGWHEVDTDKLLGENKKLGTQIKILVTITQFLNNGIHIDVETDVKNMNILLPIITELMPCCPSIGKLQKYAVFLKLM